MAGSANTLVDRTVPFIDTPDGNQSWGKSFLRLPQYSISDKILKYVPGSAVRQRNGDLASCIFISHLAFYLAFPISHLAFSTLHLAFSTLHLAFSTLHLAFFFYVTSRMFLQGFCTRGILNHPPNSINREAATSEARSAERKARTLVGDYPPHPLPPQLWRPRFQSVVVTCLVERLERVWII